MSLSAAGILLEILKAIFLGIVEGVTEWLPISSTGHMIIVDTFIKLNVSDEFKNLFLVCIQLGAIMAVVIIYWKRIWPLSAVKKNGSDSNSNGITILASKKILVMWLKVLAACIPAAIIGILFDDLFEKYFYNYICVAAVLILFGILMIIVEKNNVKPSVRNISAITYKDAVIIGLWQVIAAIFPGTSRSGATIVGSLLLGISRCTAAEFTFFLAIPVMFGASLLKIVKFISAGFSATGFELMLLAVGMITAFAVSIFIIRFLMNFIKNHSFIAFGIYRIILGAVILLLAFI